MKLAKKFAALTLSAALLLAVSACGSGGSPSGGDKTAGPGGDEKPVELVFGHIFATNSMENEAANMFAGLMEEKTGGRYTVTVYPANQLGTMAELLEQQKTGTTHIQIISTTAMASISETASIDSWPYIFNTREEFEKAYESDAGRAWIAQVEEETGFKLLSPMFKGFRQIFINKDAETVDDLKGLKLRVAGFDTILANFSAWGMSPTPMQTSEVYSAMQQNVVEGMEIELSTAASMGLAEVTKTVLMTNHAAANYTFLVYDDFYNGLPEDIQAAMSESAAETAAWLSDKVEGEDAAALDVFKDAGCKIVEPDVSGWKSIAENEYADAYPELAAIAAGMREAAQS